MDICEIVNKGPVVKNKKTALVFNNYWDITLSAIREYKDKLRTNQEESDFIDFHKKGALFSSISELQSVIESSVLSHQSRNIVTEPLEITITYGQYELLYNIITDKINELEVLLRRFSSIFLKDESVLYINMIHVRESCLNDFSTIQKKLYPAKEKTEKMLMDYIDECSYNEEFIDTDKEVTLHIHLHEKCDVLLAIDQTIYNIRERFIEKLDMCIDDDVVTINGKDAECILEKMSHQIVSPMNQITDGSRFKVNLKEYFVLKACMEFSAKSQIE